MKACSFCAEEIQDAAIVCKHCGRDLNGASTQRPAAVLAPRTQEADINKRNGFAIFVGLAVLGFVAFALTSGVWGVGPYATSSDEPLSGPTATELFARYSANEVDADNSFKGRRVMITGKVRNIGKEILGRAYVTFDVGSSLSSVQAVFANEADASMLSSGTEITVICTVDGRTLGTVVGSGCSRR